MSDPNKKHTETGEEIIFPVEDGNEKSASSGGLSWKAIVGAAILAYVIGYATTPSQISETGKTIGQLFKTGDQQPGPKPPAPTAPAQPSHEGVSSAQLKIKYWTDPMIPGFKSEKPGKSPMGMELVPVYEDAEAGAGIRIDPTVIQNIGVKTAVVTEKALDREIRTVGRVTHDERLEIRIHTKYEGWIEKLYVSFTGQEVKKNDPLIDIYSPELVSTQEELLNALKYKESLGPTAYPEILKGAEDLFESTRRRLQLFDVPEHQIESLIRDKIISKTMHIHSPVNGFVMKKEALHGQHVEPGKNLYMIIDLSNIWVLADIYEYELPWLKLGQEALMSLSYQPGATYRGKVTYIDPFLNPQTRTVRVRMEFSNPESFLKPDMYANVTLKSAISRKALAVPEDAVIRSGESTLVVVRNPDGTFTSKKVILGAKGQKDYQVIEGLREGDVVVTSAMFLIDSESKLREALGKMENPAHEAHPITPPEPEKFVETESEKPAPSHTPKTEGSDGMEGMNH